MYVSYKVDTKVHRTDGPHSNFQRESTMFRRYNDFAWLHQQLEKHYPGLIIPPLPEKQVTGRFTDQFIENRRSNLEKFLNRTACHPELLQSEDFRLFLEADDKQLKRRREIEKQSSRSSIGATFGALFESVQQFSSSLTQSTTVPKTPADLEFDEVSVYVDGLEGKMQVVYEKTQKLVKRNRDIAQTMREFSVGFAALADSENGNGNSQLSTGLSQMSSTVLDLSMESLKHAEKEVTSFEEPILDYIRILGSVKAAINKRNETKQVYDMACAEVEAKEAVNSKTPTDQLAQELVKLRVKMESARKQSDLVSARVLREVQRFKDSKRIDFKTIVHDFVQANIVYSQAVESAWQALIPQLQMIQNGA